MVRYRGCRSTLFALSWMLSVFRGGLDVRINSCILEQCVSSGAINPFRGKRRCIFFWCLCVVVMIKYANTNFRYKLLLVRRPHTFACVRNINILFGSEKHSATFQTHDEFPAIPGIWAYTGIDNTHRNLCLSVYPCPTPHMHGSGCNAQSSIKYCTRARFACACTLENLHFSQYKCVVCRICILLHVYIKDNGYEGTPTWTRAGMAIGWRVKVHLCSQSEFLVENVFVLDASIILYKFDARHKLKYIYR